MTASDRVRALQTLVPRRPPEARSKFFGQIAPGNPTGRAFLIFEGNADGGHRVSQLSIPEAKLRLSRIARVEIVRLHRLAGVYAGGLGRDAIDELLGEAISRVLDGRRAWPRDLAAVQFLAGVMRSIADEWRRKRSRDTLQHIGAAIDDEDALPRSEGHEREVALRILIEKIRAKLAGEPLLLQLFELRLNDKSPAAIQTALNLSTSAFDKEMRALKRQLVTIFPDGYPL